MTQAAFDGANPVISDFEIIQEQKTLNKFADMKQGIDFSGHRMHEIHDPP